MSLAGVHARAGIQFDRQTDSAIHLFEEQMHRYADVLHAGVGFIAGSEYTGPDDWLDFTNEIALSERYPAMSGLGILQKVLPGNLFTFTQQQRTARPDFAIKPAIDPRIPGSLPYYLPITHIAPQRIENAVLGLDVARESRRREAFELAADSGQIQISAPIQLGGAEEPGFLLIGPIYSQTNLSTSTERQEALSGAIVGSVITSNLAEKTLKNLTRQVALKVSDGGEMMYNEQLQGYANIDPNPLFQRSQVVPFFGRNWQFDVQATRAFRESQRSMEPTLILVAGLIINGLLLLLLRQMRQANLQSMAFGQRIVEKYDRQSEELYHTNIVLEERNEELQSFSYVVSHDLKSPLKGIEMLAECLEEDLLEQIPDAELKAEFSSTLKLIQKQVKLSQGLIKGVLEYSGLSSDSEEPESVDVVELLKSIQAMLAVDDDQFVLNGEFPIFETYQTQLFQVFMNLIGNGYKYHDGDGRAVITVGIGESPLPGFHRFEVSDNGPGIDQRYHQKIFDVFSTLQPKDHSMSSGVGLAIVRKLVTQHNGQILIESELGQGSTFRFDWPDESELREQSGDDELPEAA